MKNFILAIILFIGSLFAYTSSNEGREAKSAARQYACSYVADNPDDLSECLQILSSELHNSKGLISNPTTIINIGVRCVRTERNEIRIREIGFAKQTQVLVNISHSIYNSLCQKLSSLKSENLFRIYAFRKIII